MEKMKVGTLSLNINTDDLNFGAMLHSWAFQQVLGRFSEVESAQIIDYTTSWLEGFDQSKPVISYLKKKRLRCAVKTLLSHSAYIKRAKKFRRFIDTQMNVSDKKYTQASLNSETLDYDCLICESDVIWNSISLGGEYDKTFFLALDSMRDKPKIIYAASMANAQMTEKDKMQLTELLKYPDVISCRETYAAKTVLKYTDKPVETVLDPVLLLEGKDYLPITAKRLVKEPYLLIYIPFGYSEEYNKKANEYAKKRGLRVVEISFFVWNSRDHKVFSDASIEDFLSLIKNAEIVMTNSFHAVCFSILFKRQFIAVDRKTGRKTRDLCERFDINQHYFTLEDDFEQREDIDFDKLYKILDEQREKSVNWLSRALQEAVKGKRA